METARLQRRLLIFWVHYSNVNSINSIVKIVFRRNNPIFPKASIVLLDWSCRESFHILRYLADQKIPREQYEIIWIEYYDRQSKEIEVGLKECERLGKPPIVDKWIVMGIPSNVCYHKHLMYNIGIIVAKGSIVSFCDSDAIVSPTFVECIINTFDEDKNIVLHLDEVRNNDKRFYPFNYPSVEKVKGRECINWKDGKTTGLLDRVGPIHTRNYGACMSALREDLISIGGADEHVDCLGHICGLYEMTFRLVNAGRKEIWHQEEFLYHVWHPGSDGGGNYMGPHDGRNMSTTALKARITGRVMPLVENPAIRMLRLKQDDIIYEPLLLQAIPEEDVKNWTVEKLSKQRKSIWVYESFMEHPMVNLGLAMTFFRMMIKQFHMKATKFSRKPKSVKDIFRKGYKAYDFLKNMSQYNSYVFERCKNCLKELTSQNVKEIALYGTGDVAEILYKLTFDSSIKIEAVFDGFEGKKFFSFNVMPLESIINYHGKVIIAALVGVEDKVEKLIKVGVEDEKIIVL